MMKSLLKAGLIAAALMAGTQGSTADDKAEILGVISDFFKAMESNDTDAIRGIMLPEGTTFRVHDSGEHPYAASTLEQYVGGLAKMTVRLQERMVDPDVKIHGNLGSVWGFFQLYVDNKYHNCGINLFNMIKTPEGWRMGSGAYSVIEEENCSSHYSDTAWIDGEYILYSSK